MFGQVLFCNISSNGEVSPIDQSATTTYGVPQGMAVDSSGNLYVAYSGDAILKYTTNGATLFASGLGAPNFLCFDNLGNLYGSTNGSIIRIATNGTSAIYAAGIAGLNGFCFDGNGNLFASSSATNSSHNARRNDECFRHGLWHFHQWQRVDCFCHDRWRGKSLCG